MMMVGESMRQHPPSARTAPPKRTKLTSVSQLRDALRLGCEAEITEISLTECATGTVSGELVTTILLLPAVSGSIRTLDVSFNDLIDGFWSPALWRSESKPFYSLTSLKLAHNSFTEVSIGAICAFLKRCPALKVLDLSANAIGYKLCQPPTSASICDVFRTIDANAVPLETLDVSCLHVSDSDIQELVDNPIMMCRLRRLYLRSNDLTDLSATIIGSALATRKFGALQVLSLAGNQITDRGLGALAFAIDQSAALETLDLEANEITDSGLLMVFHVLNGITTRFPLRYLHLNRNRGNKDGRLVEVIRLRLQEKILEVNAAFTSHRSGEAIDSSTARSSLSFTGKRLRTELLLESVLTDHYLSVVLTAIRGCADTWSTLSELNLSGNHIGTAGACAIGVFLSLQPPCLQTLNLSKNLLDDEAVAGLADGIEWNRALHELNLNQNQITDHGAKQLYLKAFTSNLQRKILLSDGNPLTSECKVMVAAISQAYDLRKRFAKQFAHLERLDFVGQRLRQYGAAAIAECLISTPTTRCTALDLSHNLLGDEGAVEIAKILQEYPPLTKLDISFNDIGDSGAGALAEALRVNKTLVSLSLHSSIPGSATANPKLTEIGLIAIVTALEKHPALASLDLRDNAMTAALIPVLVHTFQRNPRILKFNGTSSAVFLSRNEQ